MARNTKCVRQQLDATKTVFLLCDVQEKFRPVMKYFDQIIQTSNKLINIAKILQIPLLVTEQNPKSLGHITKEIDISCACAVVTKMKFTMYDAVRDNIKAINDNKINSIVLFGLEAHVCVEQTAFDFIRDGYQVNVCADATISRSQEDRLFAFQRMHKMDAVVSTSECVIFELLKDAQHEKFRDVVKHVKTKSPSTDLVGSV